MFPFWCISGFWSLYFQESSLTLDIIIGCNALNNILDFAIWVQENLLFIKTAEKYVYICR